MITHQCGNVRCDILFLKKCGLALNTEFLYFDFTFFPQTDIVELILGVDYDPEVKPETVFQQYSQLLSILPESWKLSLNKNENLVNDYRNPHVSLLFGKYQYDFRSCSTKLYYMALLT